MTIFNVISLFGGLALFLYGMRLMGNGLKESSSGALKTAMEKVTNNPVVGFFLGLVVTAIIQSSTATIVLTSGLVGAGVITLHQSLGVVLGAVVYYLVYQTIIFVGFDTDLLKMFSAVVVGLFLGVPYLKKQISVTLRSWKGGKPNA